MRKFIKFSIIISIIFFALFYTINQVIIWNFKSDLEEIIDKDTKLDSLLISIDKSKDDDISDEFKLKFINLAHKRSRFSFKKYSEYFYPFSIFYDLFISDQSRLNISFLMARHLVSGNKNINDKKYEEILLGYWLNSRISDQDKLAFMLYYLPLKYGKYNGFNNYCIEVYNKHIDEINDDQLIKLLNKEL